MWILTSSRPQLQSPLIFSGEPRSTTATHSSDPNSSEPNTGKHRSLVTSGELDATSLPTSDDPSSVTDGHSSDPNFNELDSGELDTNELQSLATSSEPNVASLPTSDDRPSLRQSRLQWIQHRQSLTPKILTPKIRSLATFGNLWRPGLQPFLCLFVVFTLSIILGIDGHIFPSYQLSWCVILYYQLFHWYSLSSLSDMTSM